MADDLALSKPVAFWKDQIEDYERAFDKWLRRGRKLMKRYKDIRTPREEAVTRYNIFWANVQTRLPALYARDPKAQVDRRYRDKDPVGRTTSEVLERSIQYTLDHCNDTYHVNRQIILDYELPGRGVCWIRYVPHFKKRELPAAELEKHPQDDVPASKEEQGATGTDGRPGDEAPHRSRTELDAEGSSLSNNEESEVDEETLHYEETKLDYVYWEDFGHTWARTWDEVRGIWKRVYMDREELRERFLGKDMLTAEQIQMIPLDWSPKNLRDTTVSMASKKAIVYEICDKKTRETLWLVKNFPEILDVRDDPLGLDGFWPMPRPLFANILNDSLEPTPNYAFYQDQANEIDELSSRINAITKALKVAGVRDASAEGLDRLLSEGVENALVPVEGWALHKEKGGLAGVYELLPMQEIAETLASIREQRKGLIDDVYEITGIADIVRGLSDPNETATAQQLKGQFSIARIQDAQEEVQRYCRDQVRIIGQIVAGYDINTLKQISGVKLLTEEEKNAIRAKLAAIQRIQQQQAMLSAQAQHPGAPGASGGPGGPPSGAPGLPPAPGGGGPAQQPAPSPPPPGAAAAAPPGGAGLTPAPGAMPGQGLDLQPPSANELALMEKPSWEDVEGLLRNPVMREFRLDIETDSTIRMDEEAEKAARMELLKSVSDFLQQAVIAGAQSPEIVPMLAELLMYGIRAFKTARSIEQTFEDAMEALEKAAKQPRPNPEAIKAQMEQQTALAIADGKARIESQAQQLKEAAEGHRSMLEQQAEEQRANNQMQMDGQLETYKAQLKAHTDATIESQRQNFDAQKIQFEASMKERLAILEGNMRMKEKGADHAHEERTSVRQIGAQEGIERGKRGVDEKKITAAAEEPKEKAKGDDKMHGKIDEVLAHLKRPRKIVRDGSGRMAGLE